MNAVSIAWLSKLFTAKGHTHYLRTGSRAAVLKITVNGTINCRNLCEIFILGTQFTNMAAGHELERCGLVPWYSIMSTDCPVL